MKADLALRVATLKALMDWVKVLDREVRDELMAETFIGERLPAVIPGGEMPVGWVTRTKPAKVKPGLVVTDRAAYLLWVGEHRPDEVTQAPAPPPEVRSSFTAAISADGGVTDANGELHIPDGMEWVTPEPGRSQLRVVLEEGGDAAIQAAWAAGVLALPAGQP